MACSVPSSWLKNTGDVSSMSVKSSAALQYGWMTADEIRPSGSPVPLLWAATSPAKVMKTKIVSPATNLLITSLLALVRPRVARKPAGHSPRRHISTKRATRPAYRSPGVKFGADNPMNSSPAFR